MSQEVTPVKNKTRKEKNESSLFCDADFSPLGYKIIDPSVVESMINCVSVCPDCGIKNNLEVKQHNKKEEVYVSTLLFIVVPVKRQ